MSSKNAVLTIDQLEPGMVLAKDVVADRVILVSKGVVVTDALIKQLREKFVLRDIEVISNDSGKPERVKINNEKDVKDIEQSFEQFTGVVKNIFNNLDTEAMDGIKDVREFAKNIQKELHSTGSIIKSVVLYGSGSDSIYRHSVNVAALSSILAGWLGFGENKINLVTYSGILHDYGKTIINQDILNKKEQLTNEELKEIRNHPVIGYEKIKKIHFLDSSVFYGVLMHHERLDGSGYPLGFKEDKIHEFARIIAIADVFDAVNSNRVYKKSKGPFEVLEIIQKESLGKLDYEYSKVFLDHIVNYYIGENVKLSDGTIGKIIQINPNDYSRPLLLCEDSFLDLKKQLDLNVVDLVL